MRKKQQIMVGANDIARFLFKTIGVRFLNAEAMTDESRLKHKSSVYHCFRVPNGGG